VGKQSENNHGCNTADHRGRCFLAERAGPDRHHVGAELEQHEDGRKEERHDVHAVGQPAPGRQDQGCANKPPGQKIRHAVVQAIEERGLGVEGSVHVQRPFIRYQAGCGTEVRLAALSPLWAVAGSISFTGVKGWLPKACRRRQPGSTDKMVAPG